MSPKHMSVDRVIHELASTSNDCRTSSTIAIDNVHWGLTENMTTATPITVDVRTSNVIA